MKRILNTFTLLTVLLFCSYNHAQTLKGKVTDKNNFPIEEAYVYITGTNKHTHTDSEGVFALENVKAGDTLEVSHTSYKNLKVVVGDDLKTKLKLKLEEQIFDLSEVVILKKLNALKIFSDVKLEVNPVNSSQDVLKSVPGIVIGQHAGGGKAEQIFLRGFDTDHGTDINLTVEGLPVNLVSHAHGQGYADLHFIIPETIERIDFDKGPYDANKGNFATAGYVNFRLKESIDKSQVKLGIGNFNTQRLSGLFNLYNKEGTSAYIATEYSMFDGPYVSPQNFHRANLMGRFTSYLNNGDKVGALVTYLTSGWDASGQIPQRAIDKKIITRFGAIDDKEGGYTSRSNFMIDYKKNIDDNSYIDNKVFYARYGYELYSNFTFFANFPDIGDEIKQKEQREIFGVKSEYNRNFFMSDDYRINLKVGAELRNDKSNDNELSWSKNRIAHTPVKLGDIDETNIGGYINSEFKFGKWMINPGVRIDAFKFTYRDKIESKYQLYVADKIVVSPKLNFLYNYSNNFQLFLKTGKGFHSNDTRASVSIGNERKDADITFNKIIPSAYGTDLGFIWKPVPKLMFTTALWYLFLEEEITYSGDGGGPEASGKTVRKGVDLSLVYNPTTWLSFNADANYANPRATSEPKGEDYIPLAPTFTFQGGATVNHPSGFFSGVRLLHLADRPGNEDNSLIATGYTITDLNIGYKWKNFTFGIETRNLFDVEWNETQFDTPSRLKSEPIIYKKDNNGVIITPKESDPDAYEGEMHFTPGLPFNYKFTLTYSF